MQRILGFKQCGLFFENSRSKLNFPLNYFLDGDLFTVADHDVSGGGETNFAKELFFPDD